MPDVYTDPLNFSFLNQERRQRLDEELNYLYYDKPDEQKDLCEFDDEEDVEYGSNECYC